MRIINKDGEVVDYERKDMIAGIRKANAFVKDSDLFQENKVLPEETMVIVATRIYERIRKREKPTPIAEIHDIVEMELMKEKAFEVARVYMHQRYDEDVKENFRAAIDEQVLKIVKENFNDVNDYEVGSRIKTLPEQREGLAKAISEDISRRYLLPEDVVSGHDNGCYQLNGLGYYAQGTMFESCAVNLNDMLQNGTTLGCARIEKPKSFVSACATTAQIMYEVSRAVYGGQTISMSHLAPFARGASEEEIDDGVRILKNAAASLQGTGHQVTLFCYVGENKEYAPETTRIVQSLLYQKVDGIDKGNWSFNYDTSAEIVLVLEPGLFDSYIMTLANECVRKFVDIQFISERNAKTVLDAVDPPVAGNKFLPVDGKYKSAYGRFNQATVTISLPEVALRAHGDWQTFWRILDERMEMCRRALLEHHKRLVGAASEICPILWQDGAISRLGPDEKIDHMLTGGYSTLSLGYVGLFECVFALTERWLEDIDGCSAAMFILSTMNNIVRKWEEEDGISYIVCGEELPDGLVRLADCAYKRYGLVRRVTVAGKFTESFLTPSDDIKNVKNCATAEGRMGAMSKGGGRGRIMIDVKESMDDDDIVAAVDDALHNLYDNHVYASIEIREDDEGI